MSEANTEAKAGKKEGGKKEKAGGAKTVRYIARAISGLKKEEWSGLAKEAQQEHMKAAKRALLAQSKLSSRSASGKGEGKGKKGKDAADMDDDGDED